MPYAKVFLLRLEIRAWISVPNGSLPDGLPTAIMVGKQLDRTRPTLDAASVLRAMLASDHQGIARGKLVLLDVAPASNAMGMVRMSRGGCWLCNERFSLALGQSFFSLHRSLRLGRTMRRVQAFIRGLKTASKDFVMHAVTLHCETCATNEHEYGFPWGCCFA